ncbi:MAG: DUF5069 domain-containing protein [Nitrospirae bacterium]|nr:DUF5069 domain-containing protein [Nitrospirota bacterium]
MNQPLRSRLRSPRETLGGYVILPRLIDKVRLHAQGTLPEDYVGQLLMPAPALDGRLLAFTGLDAERLREAILSARTDDPVLSWVERHARPHSDSEKCAWAQEIDAYRPGADRVHLRRERYPEVAATVDVGAISVFDLIDLDEGRLPE